MKTALFGNGINIQFGGPAYQSYFILERIRSKALAGDLDDLFEGTLKGGEIAALFDNLANLANEVIAGDYTFDINDSEVEEALRDFQRRYNHKIDKSHQVLLEDYFILLEATMLKFPELKLEKGGAYAGMKWIILDAIYNDGRVEEIFSTMDPKIRKKLKKFLCSFDEIFTINYDSNIDRLCGKEAIHLHGDYRKLESGINPYFALGYANKLEGEEFLVEGKEHCRCNALLSYSGAAKKRFIDSAKLINGLSVEKMKEVLPNISDPKIAKAIKTRIQNPNLPFEYDYGFDNLKNISGEISIIGMSPNNDDHIFEILLENHKIDKIIYYYFQDEERELIESRFSDRKVETVPVKSLWKELGCSSSQVKYPIPASMNFDKTVDRIIAITGNRCSIEKIRSELQSLSPLKRKRLGLKLGENLEKRSSSHEETTDQVVMQDFSWINYQAFAEGIHPATLYYCFLENHPKKKK